MIDSHCHFDLDAFAHDRNKVLQQAIQKGITKLHIPGTTADRWPALLTYAANPLFDISLGLHPYFLTDSSAAEQHLTALEDYISQHQQAITAVGECGLDSVIKIPMALQHKVFKRQIALAEQFNKPLIVHARKTHHLIVQDIKQMNFNGRGIIHAFSGGPEVADHYVERDWLLGIGGTITYPRGRKTQQTIKHVGLEHIVLETDAPDMPLNGFQGQRNTPAQLGLVAQAVADLLNVSLEHVIKKTTQNYLRLVSQ